MFVEDVSFDLQLLQELQDKLLDFAAIRLVRNKARTVPTPPDADITSSFLSAATHSETFLQLQRKSQTARLPSSVSLVLLLLLFLSERDSSMLAPSQNSPLCAYQTVRSGSERQNRSDTPPESSLDERVGLRQLQAAAAAPEFAAEELFLCPISHRLVPPRHLCCLLWVVFTLPSRRVLFVSLGNCR